MTVQEHMLVAGGREGKSTAQTHWQLNQANSCCHEKQLSHLPTCTPCPWLWSVPQLSRHTPRPSHKLLPVSNKAEYPVFIESQFTPELLRLSAVSCTPGTAKALGKRVQPSLLERSCLAAHQDTGNPALVCASSATASQLKSVLPSGPSTAAARPSLTNASALIITYKRRAQKLSALAAGPPNLCTPAGAGCAAGTAVLLAVTCCRTRRAVLLQPWAAKQPTAHGWQRTPSLAAPFHLDKDFQGHVCFPPGSSEIPGMQRAAAAHSHPACLVGTSTTCHIPPHQHTLPCQLAPWAHKHLSNRISFSWELSGCSTLLQGWKQRGGCQPVTPLCPALIPAHSAGLQALTEPGRIPR